MKFVSRFLLVFFLCLLSRAEAALQLPREIQESPDLSAAMTMFYTSLAKGDLEAAMRFLAPSPKDWADPDQRILNTFKRRAGAKRFLFFASGPAAPGGNHKLEGYVISGVFVDRDGVFFMREDSKSQLIENCSFTDVWVNLPTGWHVMDGGLFKLDHSAYLNQLATPTEP